MIDRNKKPRWTLDGTIGFSEADIEKLNIAQEILEARFPKASPRNIQHMLNEAYPHIDEMITKLVKK